MAKLKNYMASDYDVIRAVLKKIFVYGCYTPSQLEELYNIPISTYKDAVLRIFFALNEKYLKSNNKGEKRITFIQYDRYDNIANLLIRTYKMKTSVKNSMEVIALILQILADGYNRTIPGIAHELYDEYNSTPKFQNIYSYIKILCDLGYVIEIGVERTKITGFKKQNETIDDIIEYMESTKLKQNIYVKRKWYRLAPDILKKITEINNNLLKELNQILYMYRHIMPMSSLGHMVQEVTRRYILCAQCDEINAKDNFIFKDIFYWHMLEDEVLLHIVYAWEEKKKITFTYLDKDGTKEIVNGIPYKILVNDYDNRQYLFLEIENILKVYRLDMIYGVVISKSSDKLNNIPFSSDSIEYPIEKCQTGYLDYSSVDQFKTVEVIIDFYFDDNNKYLKTRLEQEKRNGRIEIKDEIHYVFGIEVIKAQISALIPWVRSYGYTAKVRKSDEHQLYESIRNSYKEMMENYV